jgi:FtsH-binding integral membrane protein
MKTVRNALSLIVVILLGGGYAASQAAVLQGRAVEYARQIDQPAVHFLALVLFIGCIVLAFFPEREGESEP